MVVKPLEIHTNDPVTAKITVAAYIADVSTPTYDVGNKTMVEWLSKFAMAYEAINAVTYSGERDSNFNTVFAKIKSELKIGD